MKARLVGRICDFARGFRRGVGDAAVCRRVTAASKLREGSVLCRGRAVRCPDGRVDAVALPVARGAVLAWGAVECCVGEDVVEVAVEALVDSRGIGGRGSIGGRSRVILSLTEYVC